MIDAAEVRKAFGMDLFEFEFVPRFSERGRGFIVAMETAIGSRKLRWDNLPEGLGLVCFPVKGVHFRRDNLQHDSFSFGRPLRVIAEPENPKDPTAIAVWNGDETLQAGYLPRPRLNRKSRNARTALLKNIHALNCFCVWENIRAGERVGIRILLVEKELDAKLRWGQAK